MFVSTPRFSNVVFGAEHSPNDPAESHKFPSFMRE